MLRRCLTVVALLGAFAALAPAAGAQTPPTQSSHAGSTQFVDMAEYFIDGARKTPTVLLGGARRTADFGRIMRLRRSFVPRLQQTAREAALR